MSKFPFKNRIRKKHHDYDGEYIYFVTLNLQSRPLQLMGEIIDGEMHLSEAGKMIMKWYNKLESKFPYLECHEMVIMPDHMHFIVQVHKTIKDELSSMVAKPPSSDLSVGTNPNHNKHLGTKLITVLQWFKTMTTNEYIRGVKEKGWPRFEKKLWQCSYHELIVYDDRAFNNIENYIKNNPKNWKT